MDVTRIISGRSSIQGICKVLSTGFTKPGSAPVLKSFGFIVSSELSASLVSDPAALTILTDLFDRQYNDGEYTSLLKMETFQLKDPTVTLLGGINDAHAETFFEKKDIQGGLFARTFIIYEKEEQSINSLSRRVSNPPDKEHLAAYLKEIAKLKGKFTDFWDETNNLTPVGRYYDEWYHNFRNEMKKMGVKDETGTLNRLGDSVLKIAMLLALGREPTLTITLPDIEFAIQLAETLVGNIRQTTHGKKGLSTAAAFKNQVIRELYLRDNHTVSRAVLMKKMWMHFSTADEFDEMMNSFHDSGLIVHFVMGNQMMFTMPDEQVKELKDFFEGKNK